MKPQFLVLPFLILFIGLIALPRAAIANLNPPDSPLPNPSPNFRGGATTTGEPGLGGEVVGDGTPDSCTDTALAQALAGGGQISFDCGPNPHIILLASQKVITAETSLDGGGLITLSGVNLRRHFTVDSTAILTLRNLTLTAGSVGTGESGGSVRNNGVLVTENVTFTNNLVATGNGGAGALYNNGASLLSDTHFIENRSATGGALYNTVTGTVTITNSTFISNTALTPATDQCRGHYCGGGAIRNDGTLTYHGGLVRGNRATEGYADGSCGGAVANYGTASFYDVELRQNLAQAGSVLYAVGDTLFERATLIDNSDVTTATAYYVINAWGGTMSPVPARLTIRNSEIISNTGTGMITGQNDLLVENSTIANNTEYGIYTVYTSHALIINSTVSGNRVGIETERGTTPVRVINSTLANERGNVSMTFTSTLWLQNTTLSVEASNGTNCGFWHPEFGWYDFRSDGYNLADDGSCPLTQTTDYMNTEPLLGALQDNGGDTLTHLPAANSPLLDHGLCLNEVPTDQRGISRPQGAACDIGAVERATNEGATPTPTATITATPTSTPSATSTVPPNSTATPTPTGTPPIFTERLYLPLTQR